jgi:hypothetical protein
MYEADARYVLKNVIISCDIIRMSRYNVALYAIHGNTCWPRALQQGAHLLCCCEVVNNQLLEVFHSGIRRNLRVRTMEARADLLVRAAQSILAD